MTRAELHAEAIRIQRAMYEAPRGEQVTVLFAALLNLVQVRETPAPECPWHVSPACPVMARERGTPARSLCQCGALPGEKHVIGCLAR